MESRNAYRGFVGKTKDKAPFRRPSVGRKIKIKWILNHLYMRVWTGFVWLRTVTSSWLLLTWLKKVMFHTLGIS
jgi:hypothetical protein